MEGNVDSEDGLMNMTEDISTVDFDLVADGVDWCDQCKKLKQELQQLQEEHALNYNTLKKKIISTDLLIKKFKAKSEDHESQTKKLEETMKKCDQLQRESETLRAQLGSSLQQLEPLKLAKESMEAESRYKDMLIQTLQDRLTSAVSARLQYESLSKSNSCFKEKYEETKKENGKKIHTLELSNQRQETQINKLKEDLKSVKSEHSLLLKKHRKLEQRLHRAVEKLEKYWAILKTNGLLPKGDKKLRKENYLDLSVATDESQSQEEDTYVGEPKNIEIGKDMDDSCDEEDLTWSFSPMIHALSPLPPTPTICHRGDSIDNSYHSNSSDEDAAEQIEKQILHSSPIRRSPRKHSIWKRLPQTKSSPSKLLKNKKSKLFAAASKLTFNEKAAASSNRNNILSSYLGVSKENCNPGLLNDLSRDLSESDDEDLKTPRKVPVRLKTKSTTKEISPLIREKNIDVINDDQLQCENTNNMFRPISEDSNDSVATLNSSLALTKKLSPEKIISEDSNDSNAISNNGLAITKTLSPKKTAKKSMFDSDSDSDSRDTTLTADPVIQNNDDHMTQSNDHMTKIDHMTKNNDDSAKENQSKDDTDFSVPPRLSPQILNSPNNKTRVEKSLILTRSKSMDSSVKILKIDSKKKQTRSGLKYKPISFVRGEVLNPQSSETKILCPETGNSTSSNVPVELDTNSVEHCKKSCELSDISKEENSTKPILTRSKLKSSPKSENRTEKVSPKRLLRCKSEPGNVTDRIPSHSAESQVTESKHSSEFEINGTKINEKCKTAPISDVNKMDKSNTGEITHSPGGEIKDGAIDKSNTGEITQPPSDNLSGIPDENNTQFKDQNGDALKQGDKKIVGQKVTNKGKMENSLSKDGSIKVDSSDKPACSKNLDRHEEGMKNDSIEKASVDKKVSGEKLNKNSASHVGSENEEQKGSGVVESDSVSNKEKDPMESVVLMDDSVWSPQRFTRAMSRQVSTGFVIKSLSIEKESLESVKTKRNTLTSVDESIEEETSNETDLPGDIKLTNSGQNASKDTISKSSSLDINERAAVIESNKNQSDQTVKSENLDSKGANSVKSNQKDSVASEKQIDNDKASDLNKKFKTDDSEGSNTHDNVVDDKSKLSTDNSAVSDRTERVVSPELAEIAGGSSSVISRSATPVSLSGSSSSSPMIAMSPLPMSPFRFITPLSPLPPSPVRELGLLSPLPEGGDLLSSAGLVDVHHLSTSESETNTPIGTPVPFAFSSDADREKQNARQSPCSFHSVVPSGVIRVKPKPGQQKTTSKKSGDVEDPPEVTKQRRKRKSIEQHVPVVGKKSCTDENVSKSQLPGPAVSLSYKVLEREMKNYLNKKNTMPLAEFVQRLLSKDETESVMSFLILWTTQALRCSEVDLLYLIHTSTANDEMTPPYFTDQESKLLSLFSYLIQQNIWAPLRQKLMEALWNCIFLPDIVPVAGRSSLCRFFTGLCRLEGDLEQVRVMFYTCMTSSYLSYATLGLAVVSVWPEVLYKSNTEPNTIITVMEHCIMSKLRVDEKQKHDQMSECYSKLCNWTFPLQSSDSLLKSLLHSLDAATKTETTKTCNKAALKFELLKSVELLFSMEDLVLFKTTFVQSALNITMQKWKSRKSETNVNYDLCVIRIVGSVLPKQKDITVRYVNDVIKKYLIPLLNCKYDMLEVCTVEVLLELSPLSPQLAFNTLYQWYRRNRSSVKESLKNKLEHFRQTLASKVKFHCPPFS